MTADDPVITALRGRTTDIYRPIGLIPYNRRYVVARTYRSRLVLMRAGTISQAKLVASEWNAGLFIQPGEERLLHCAPLPHPPLIAYRGPEHLKETPP